MTLLLREQEPLAQHTTLGLGGPARYFHECTTEAELREALTWARERRLRAQIMVGGSNLVVADGGFAGFVLKLAIGVSPPRETIPGVQLPAHTTPHWDARGGLPQLRYAELAQAVRHHGELERLAPADAVSVVRNTVLELRRRKSMVLDPTDPNGRSVGSFFMNPVLSADAFDRLVHRWGAAGEGDGIPMFPADGRVKVPAAWLIEQAGFRKGYRR